MNTEPNLPIAKALPAAAAARKPRRQGFLAQLLRHKGGRFGLACVVLFLLLALFGRFVVPFDPNASEFTSLLTGPSARHWFGTDELGRDTLSRVVAGSGIALAVAMLSVAIAMVLGVLIGVVAGYFGGLVDTVLNRSQDVLFAFPTLLLAIIIVAVLGPAWSTPCWPSPSSTRRASRASRVPARWASRPANTSTPHVSPA